MPLAFQALTEQRAAQPDGHTLDLGVILQRLLSELATDAALLVATETRLVPNHVVAWHVVLAACLHLRFAELTTWGILTVDPDSAGLEFIADANGGVQILGVDGGS